MPNPRRPPISEAKRRQILDMLGEGRLSGREIAEVVGVSEAMVRKVKNAAAGPPPARTARQQVAAQRALLALATAPQASASGDTVGHPVDPETGEYDIRAAISRLLPLSLQVMEEMIRSPLTAPRVRSELIQKVADWAISSADTRVRANAEQAGADGMARVIADAIAPLSEDEQQRVEVRRVAARALIESRRGLITSEAE